MTLTRYAPIHADGLSPEIKRNGFDGNLHGILPYDFFKAILSDSRAGNIAEVGQHRTLALFPLPSAGT